MIEHVAKQWWLVALRGIVSILFGVAAFLLPGITLVVLILFFGAYMFVDGVIALVSAIRFRHERERWVALLVEGILGIAVGVVTYLWPGITALAWVFTIGAWAIVTGVLEIVAAVRLRAGVGAEVLLILTGIASIALGLAFAIFPLAGLLAWVWMIGAYAIVFGVLLLAFAFRLRHGLGKPTSSAVVGGSVP